MTAKKEADQGTNPRLPRRGRIRAPSWASYDEVADPYDPYPVRKGYALLARDLLLTLGLQDGATVVDVGTGTGLRPAAPGFRTIFD